MRQNERKEFVLISLFPRKGLVLRIDFILKKEGKIWRSLNRKTRSKDFASIPFQSHTTSLTQWCPNTGLNTKSFSYTSLIILFTIFCHGNSWRKAPCLKISTLMLNYYIIHAPTVYLTLTFTYVHFYGNLR